ncbi:Coagulation factor 5/8 C-terminal domain,Tyrosine-protein kinase, active site,Protein kinase [Cinara cedri]|uniref:Coagulation factor 5/8 C-terminal domain,Tyrosine-protein kinase, active site,Protein kinase n=1 Tax=Cinara cedri TaxID=506608 RepID=A0A5E4MEA0_9HEMI|nr:Coagulation factor 5/8 C-terminal domain,Tyrosine-protein kinase, active site,Protein kinase [Cinara cedri]
MSHSGRFLVSDLTFRMWMKIIISMSIIMYDIVNNVTNDKSLTNFWQSIIKLKVERAGGGWCPKPAVEQGVREWLQVDFKKVHMITGIQTQGRFGNGRGLEYAEEYTIEYLRPGLSDWKPYKRWDGKQIISGNTDTSTVVLHHLLPPVYASQLRILPYSIHRRTVCLRAEIRGCPSDHGITSYTIPLDGSPGNNTEVRDFSYDGTMLKDKIQGGLGILVDGVHGEDNFKMDIGYGKGNGWVGWRKESFPEQGFVELIFEFNEVRNFSAVHIFTNNFFSKNVQVFSKAKVQFSVGGLHYQSRSIWYTYMPDMVLENARDVDIQLQNHVGKYVKIQLYFSNKWIMISEVKFDSEPLLQNATVDAEMASEDEQLFGGALDPPWDSPDTTTHKEKDDRTGGGGLVEVFIGVLTAATLILLGICAIVLALSRRKKHQTVISTSIFKKPFGGVTMNMKDIFMNLSPHNNNTSTNNNNNNSCNNAPGGGSGNRHITENPLPIGEQMRSDSFTSDVYDKSQHVVYETPLLSRKDYETIRCSSKITDVKSSAISAQEFCHSDSERGSLSSLEIEARPTEHSIRDSVTSLHYRSLQNQALPMLVADVPIRPKHLQCTADVPSRKRFHTAPREKHRMAPPSVSWNISPSMGQAYKCREADIVQIPRYCLNVVSKLGSSHLGEVAICETLDVRITDNGRVAAKVCTRDSTREVKFLCSLLDPNLVRVFGVCANESPPWLITEYPAELGDLVIVLRTHSTLTYTTLMFMATQIASAMKYLESKNVVHKDLAARNCLVSRGYSIKVADVAVCNPAYKKDYSEIGNRPPAPIRWLPWESILLDRHTCPSTVWSFAVTMWELLSMARDKPFPHLTNEQVIHNAEQMYYGGELQVLLPKPNLCPAEIYELMCQCWKRDQNLRPTFKQLYHFLKRNHTTYSCEIDKQLHNVSPI